MKNFVTIIFALFLFSGVMTAGVVSDVGDGFSEKENIVNVADLSVELETVNVVDFSVDEAITVDGLNLQKQTSFIKTEKVAGIVETYKSLHLAEDYQPDINETKAASPTPTYNSTPSKEFHYLHRMSSALLY